ALTLTEPTLAQASLTEAAAIAEPAAAEQVAVVPAGHRIHELLNGRRVDAGQAHQPNHFHAVRGVRLVQLADHRLDVVVERSGAVEQNAIAAVVRADRERGRLLVVVGTL